MGFILKKIVSQFCMPETFSLLLIVIGIFLLLLTKKQKTGKIFVTLGTLFIILFSYKFTADYLSGTLEKQYPPISQNTTYNNVKYIVVLGGGIKYDKTQPVSSQIGKHTLVRLIEGIRLLKLYPEANLILSGGKVFNPESEAQIMKSVSNILGIDDSKIILDPVSLDTGMQAENIKKIVKTEEFFLVTSTIHMPRSMLLFKSGGMKPIAAPTRFTVQPLSSSPFDYFPAPGNLEQCNSIFHEYTGIAWFYFKLMINKIY